MIEKGRYLNILLSIAVSTVFFYQRQVIRQTFMTKPLAHTLCEPVIREQRLCTACNENNDKIDFLCKCIQYKETRSQLLNDTESILRNKRIKSEYYAQFTMKHGPLLFPNKINT